jgi:hypothetical protein
VAALGPFPVVGGHCWAGASRYPGHRGLGLGRLLASHGGRRRDGRAGGRGGSN